MTDKHGKIDVKLGALAFTGEGEQDWLSAQLQKLIDCAELLDKIPEPKSINVSVPNIPTASAAFQDSLATYLKTKTAEKNQNMRFLVTADWLRRRGAETLTSGMVSRALLDNQQSRLGNPSECLNQNVAKGLCEKTPGGFFITPEGLKVLGHQ